MEHHEKIDFIQYDKWIDENNMKRGKIRHGEFQQNTLMSSRQLFFSSTSEVKTVT